ncbi:MAG: Hsp70 family protein, partial [Gammaproteobacteria bacterium]
DYASDDMHSRMLREQQVEAERVVEALDAALKKDGDELLSEEEKDNISEARELLVNAKASDDSENIKAAIKKLENACADYVARRMNSNIRNAMQGHSVEEYAGKDQE